MDILHLSTSDIDNGGARAAYRLHQGLRSLGCTSRMLVRAKFSSDPTVIAERSPLTKLSPPISEIPLRLYPRNSGMFSPQWFPDVLGAKIAQLNPDAINLHWVNNGYLRIETLARLNKPLVWTIHDMWPFTGGCHYSQDCDRYKNSCGACPQLHSSQTWDLSRWIWQRKAKAWKNLNLTLVSPSNWLAKCASASSLFSSLRIEVIPNSLDVKKYKQIDKNNARNILNLPQNKHLIMFGKMNIYDTRKGFNLLQTALQNLSKNEWGDKLELVIFGPADSNAQTDWSLPTHYLGKLGDDIALALVYSAADVFVAPSIQDNLPNTVMEAIACGTPSVAFNIGGMPDMIEHQQNGYLATPFEVEDLAKGIVWVLEDKERHQKLQFHAREKSLREFAAEVQARRYLSVYKEVLGGFK